MTRIIIGILLVGIGIGSFYYNISQVYNRPYKVASLPHYGHSNMRGGHSDINYPQGVSARIEPTFFENLIESITADRLLNWLANIVTIVTGVLLILRRRRED